MFQIDRAKNQIILKGNAIFLGIGVLVVVMAIMGVCLRIGLSPFEEMHTFMVVVGVIFISIWLLALFCRRNIYSCSQQ